ncbi:hypothetical protein Cfor_11338 [Coptotermes formosanus]|uniref:N-acetyltransferase domain-containing protein n=1 Tax=Coptotermes formosanus TaxID=36987 RepID=A0A6L2PAM7_COPFO|nr:hypothetical protein Cfor_11338 [Coptotermes formosanus]
MEVLEIHRYPQLMDQCCDLINMEWPRSKTARLRRLEMSCDSFPTCLVLVCSNEVLGHSKLSSLPSLPLGCLIESVVVHPEHRGKGLGKFLMTKSEDHARRQGMETLYLYTKDKQGFYSKIGYTECEPVQIYGQHVLGQNSKNVPLNETDAKGNINVPAQVVSPTALSVPPVSNMYPQTKTLIQLFSQTFLAMTRYSEHLPLQIQYHLHHTSTELPGAIHRPQGASLQ